MVEVQPISKEDQVAPVAPKCPRTGEMKRACKCSSCVGRRNRKKGSAGQRVARKALGLNMERWSGRHADEETWTSTVRVEVKAGGTMANPVGLRYQKMREQSDAAKAIGDSRPFVGCVKPDGWSDVVVMIRGQDLPDVVAALMEEWSASTKAGGMRMPVAGLERG